MESEPGAGTTLPSTARADRSGAAGQACMKTIRILLADDHTVVRKGLRLLLESQPGFTVVAEAANGREAVATGGGASAGCGGDGCGDARL